MKEQLIKIVEEFAQKVRDVVGLYSDATDGFNHLRNWTVSSQKDAAAFYRSRGIKKTTEEIENEPIISVVQTAVHFNTDGTHYEAKALHSSSRKQTIERNTSQGSNELRMCQLALVMIYSLWEYHTRCEIEALLGKRIQVDIFSELAQLRHCILKNSGKISSKAFKKLSRIKFKKDEEIFFTGGDFVEFLNIVGKELSGFVNQATFNFPVKSEMSSMGE